MSDSYLGKAVLAEIDLYRRFTRDLEAIVSARDDIPEMLQTTYIFTSLTDLAVVAALHAGVGKSTAVDTFAHLFDHHDQSEHPPEATPTSLGVLDRLRAAYRAYMRG